MEMNSTKMNPIRVTIVLNCGDQVTGEINIMSFKRFSDFIETHGAKHLKVFNITKDMNTSDLIADFFLIPKTNIRYYQSFGETGE